MKIEEIGTERNEIVRSVAEIVVVLIFSEVSTRV
jgi:hypothetical protein